MMMTEKPYLWKRKGRQRRRKKRRKKTIMMMMTMTTSKQKELGMKEMRSDE